MESKDDMEFKVLECIDVYVRMVCERFDEYDRPYELDDDFRFHNLTPIIDDNTVVYRTPEQLEDILNACWTDIRYDTAWDDYIEIAYFPRVESCKVDGDTMKIYIEYTPNTVIEEMTETIFLWREDTMDYINWRYYINMIREIVKQLGEENVPKLNQKIPDRTHAELKTEFKNDENFQLETKIIDFLYTEAGVLDMAMVLYAENNEITDEDIINRINGRYTDTENALIGYFVTNIFRRNSQLRIDQKTSLLEYLGETSLEQWQHAYSTRPWTVEEFKNMFHNGFYMPPEVQILVQDDLITFEKINTPCRLITDKLEKYAVYDIETVYIMLNSTATSPITRKDITRVQIMDEDLIRTFNKQHTEIQQGEMKVQELREVLRTIEKEIADSTPEVHDAKKALKDAKKQARNDLKEQYRIVERERASVRRLLKREEDKNVIEYFNQQLEELSKARSSITQLVYTDKRVIQAENNLEQAKKAALQRIRKLKKKRTEINDREGQLREKRRRRALHDVSIMRF